MSARDATESKQNLLGGGFVFLVFEVGVAGLAGIEQLLVSLEQLERGSLEGKEDDLAFLRGMLKTPEFHSLLKVQPRPPPPATPPNAVCPL